MKNLSTLLLLTVLTLTATAADYTVEEVVEKVKASYDGATSLTCDVRRVTASGMLGQRRIVRGTLRMLLPEMFRIDYVAPYEQSLICNGETVWIYTPKNEQVVVSSVTDYQEREMLGNLIGYFERDYTYEDAGTATVDGRATMVLKMVARTDQVAYPSGRLWVDTERWLPAEVELTDDIGNTISYRLSNIKLNQSLSKSIFSFTPPDGVEVIEY